MSAAGKSIPCPAVSGLPAPAARAASQNVAERLAVLRAGREHWLPLWRELSRQIMPRKHLAQDSPGPRLPDESVFDSTRISKFKRLLGMSALESLALHKSYTKGPLRHAWEPNQLPRPPTSFVLLPAGSATSASSPAWPGRTPVYPVHRFLVPGQVPS